MIRNIMLMVSMLAISALVSAEKLLLTAELSAKEYTLISVPYTERSGWSKKIIWMADEGSIVEKGAPAVRFDPGGLLDEILSKEQAIEAVENNQLAQDSKREIELADAQLSVRTKTRELEKAKLQLSKITSFSSKKEAADAQFEVAKAISALKEAKLALDNTKTKHSYDKAAIESNLAKMKAELLVTQSFTERMEFLAPERAILVYASSNTGTGERKVQEGDTLETGSAVAKLFPINSLQLTTYINEVDSLLISDTNRSVSIYFDARPEEKYAGEIVHVESYSQPLPKRGTGRWIEVEVKLLNEIQDWMHTGMNARIEVELDD